LIALIFLFAFPLATRSQETGDVSKTPFEAIDLGLDFINRAPNGITISSVVATNLTTGANVTTTIIVNTPDAPIPAVVPGTSKVIVRVRNGTIGDRYNVGVRVNKIDTGESLEGNIYLRIVAAQ
jgi:hypothetical protein